MKSLYILCICTLHWNEMKSFTFRISSLYTQMSSILHCLFLFPLLYILRSFHLDLSGSVFVIPFLLANRTEKKIKKMKSTIFHCSPLFKNEFNESVLDLKCILWRRIGLFDCWRRSYSIIIDYCCLLALSNTSLISLHHSFIIWNSVREILSVQDCNF